MKVGLSTAALFGRMETEEALALIVQKQVPCAEVFIQCPDEYPLLIRQKNALGDTRISSIHLLSAMVEPGLFSKSARMRKYTLNVIRRAFDVAQALGAKYYVFHGMPPSISQKAHIPEYDQLALRMRPLLEAAKEHAVAVAWENVYWSSFACPEFAGEIVKRLPEVVFTLDIKQAHHSGRGVYEYMEAMGARLRHVHVCGIGEDGRPCMPEQGKFDLGRFSAALSRLGYEGDVILEPYADLYRDADQLFESLRFVNRAFQEEKICGI